MADQTLSRGVGSQGVLRVVPPAVLEQQIKQSDQQKAALQDQQAGLGQAETSNLAAFVRTQYEIMRNHRNLTDAGWSERLLSAQRVFNGQYDARKLQEIRKFGGSEVYARIISMKCRTASALLRDVYLGNDRPWGIDPPSDPDIPPEVTMAIGKLVETEVSTLVQAGQPIDPNAIRDRILQLTEAARQAQKKRAKERATLAEERIDEILGDGEFYKAFAEFLVDLPLFPFACIKGPIVKITPEVTWSSDPSGGNVPTVVNKPKLYWSRISPFDIYFTPGSADIEGASVIERMRLSRADLNDLLDLPGYDTVAIRNVLKDYGTGGLVDDWDQIDTERAVQERRENPSWNRSGMIACLEFHGNVQGQMLQDMGIGVGQPLAAPKSPDQGGFGAQAASQKLDPDRDYMTQLWLIGRYIIKAQVAPSPRKRHPYFITSFEKVPGTPVGNALPDILADIQDVCNSAMRSLVNNMSIASGPQAVVNFDRLAPGENGDEMYPWKRWHVKSDPVAANTVPPITFFQPNSNSQELMAVYQKFSDIGDELSAIPKYMAGTSLSGGAGRTASGLAMLMGNASKILQTVAANVDRDVVEPALYQLFDLILLTDQTGVFKGDETVRVRGVGVAMQRETQRSRQLEFLQITANPIDAQIMGTKGRAAVLRSVSETIGMDGTEIVPTDDELQAQQMAAQQQQPGAPPNGVNPANQQAAEQAAQAQGGQQGPPSTGDMGPRTNLQQQRPRISGGVQ